MRRKDREITDSDRIQEIIDACQCMRIAFADGACAYIVPVNFGYDKAGKAFYFHGAAQGRKIDRYARMDTLVLRWIRTTAW